MHTPNTKQKQHGHWAFGIWAWYMVINMQMAAVRVRVWVMSLRLLPLAFAFELAFVVCCCLLFVSSAGWTWEFRKAKCLMPHKPKSPARSINPSMKLPFECWVCFLRCRSRCLLPQPQQHTAIIRSATEPAGGVCYTHRPRFCRQRILRMQKNSDRSPIFLRWL